MSGIRRQVRSRSGCQIVASAHFRPSGSVFVKLFKILVVIGSDSADSNDNFVALGIEKNDVM